MLVTNYNELEEVLGDILDESGPILKGNLAKVTQAVAIDNLVSGNMAKSFCAVTYFQVIQSTKPNCTKVFIGTTPKYKFKSVIHANIYLRAKKN